MAVNASAQTPENCTRPLPGATVVQPPELRSSSGRLHAQFSLRTALAADGLTRYCYQSGEGFQNPTLRVHPGDEIVLTLKNELPASLPAESAPHHRESTPDAGACGHGAITASSSNLHFHGVAIPPACHQDEVVRTRVQPGDAPFEYRIRIPANQPPGLYWYHPHVHGFSELQVQGGASGALVVEGIEKANPAVASLPERLIVLRDQPIGGFGEAQESAAKATEEGEEQWRPALDASLNFVPVTFPDFKPAVVLVRPANQELWRVLNASSGTFFNLQLLYWPPGTELVQPLKIVALDGVPTGLNYASVERKSVLLPPGSRAEFTLSTPPAGMHAQLVTTIYDNGPAGDRNTYRVLANLRATPGAPAMPNLPAAESTPPLPLKGADSAMPVRERLLYFSEKVEDPAHPKPSTSYFLTEQGATPKIFDMNSPVPNITAVQGTVEDWTIENRAPESHVFHIHQVHFQVLERDGKRVGEQVLRDTIDIPFWDGKSAYPKIKVRMDFRDPGLTGTFPYHCHILEHEDRGMMGLIEIVRP